ncbi:MAG: hypothetical protein HYW90_01180 [Candidatus Sungbacteria bacterium]|nr:hypothetical protein [Candidatus Sungbacteria bacterium]
MKPLFTLFVLIGFVGIAVFGFMIMGHGNDHGGCIVAIAKGIDCPEGWNTFSFAKFHLDTFRSFSAAIFSDSIGGLLLLLFFIVFWFGVIPRFQFYFLFNRPFAAYRFLDSSWLVRRELTHWLALHENSPASFLLRR